MENLTTFVYVCLKAWNEQLAGGESPVFGTVARVPVSYFSRNSMEFSQTRLLDTQKLGSSDFHNDLTNLKGKIKQNWSTFQQHFIQSPKIKSPNPSTLSFPNALCQPSSVVSANAGSPRSGNCLGVSLEQVVVWARKPNPLCCLSHPLQDEHKSWKKRQKPTETSSSVASTTHPYCPSHLTESSFFQETILVTCKNHDLFLEILCGG